MVTKNNLKIKIFIENSVWLLQQTEIFIENILVFMSIMIILINLNFLLIKVLFKILFKFFKKKSKFLVELWNKLEYWEEKTIKFMICFITSFYIIRLIHKTLELIVLSKSFLFFLFELHVMYLNHFIVMWVFIFIFNNLYKVILKFFFKFETLITKTRNFLLKMFPSLSRLILFLMLNLLYICILEPKYITILCTKFSTFLI